MLRTLIWKEIVAHVLSLRFAVTFVLFLILIFASIHVGVITHLEDRAEHAARVRADRQHMSDIFGEEKEDDTRERLFWREGRNDAVPPARLAWLGQGLQQGYPVGLNIARHWVTSVERGPTRNPLLDLLRVPDFVYVISTVLSLLAMVLMFDAICGEKESGSLRLVLSNSVPRHELLLAKWIGGYAVLIVPFLIAVGGGIGYAWIRGAFQPTADDATRVALTVVVACIYIAVFFNVGLFVSTTTSRSNTALLICLLIWVTCIMVIPNLGPVTARIVDPAPSLKSVEASKRAVHDEINLRKRRLTVTSGELWYGSTVQKAQEELDRERQQRIRQLDAYFQSRKDSQMRLARTFGRISPAACWTYAAVALTGTGPAAYERFQRDRDSAGRRFHDYSEQLVQEARKTRWREWPEVREGDVPSFRLSVPDTGEAIVSALNDILIMLVLTVVFFMLSFVFFLRYDVR